MSVVYSSSINNSFISTVDHLPTDVVRSLWLLQSLNIRIEKLENSLDELLSSHQQHAMDPEVLTEKYTSLIAMIDHLRQESIQESQALYNQLIAHKLSLSEEVDQLFGIQNELQNADTNFLANKELRERLKVHYTENPLVSQREALKEQEMIKNSNPKPSEKLGLKLLLKLPKSKDSSKNINRHIKQSKAVTMKSPPSKNNKITKSHLETSPKHKLIHKKQKAASTSNVLKVHKKKALSQAPPPPPVTEEPVVPIETETDQKYCFCKQGSFGAMIGCDNEDSCPNGDWFHYKCVGLLNRVDALQYTTGKTKWFCSEYCRDAVMNKPKKKKKKKRHGW